MQTEHKRVVGFGIVGSRQKYVKGKSCTLKSVIPLCELDEDIINGLGMNHSRNTTDDDKPYMSQSSEIIHLGPL